MNDQRRASDELLLRMIREGRHDSEIAVRLGISTGELRGRKNDLRNRLGHERWEQAIGAASAKSRSGRKRFFFWGIGSAAGLLAILLVIANVFAGEDDDAGLISAEPVATPTTSPSNVLKTPAVVTLDGVEYDDVGIVFSGASIGGKVSLVADNRAGLSVLRFGGTTFVSPTEFADWGISGGGGQQLVMRARIGRRNVEVGIGTESDATKLRTIGSGVGPIMELSSATPAGAPTVIVMAYGAQRQRLQVRVENDGRMFIARSPIPASWVIEESSGARIDVSAARALGSLGTTGGLSTQCAQGTGTLICQVFVFGGNIPAPADGVIRCVGDGGVRFEAGPTVLLLTPFAGRPACTARDVARGESLVASGQWHISSVDPVGSRVSVAVSRDGTLYLGEMRGTVLCPCLQGS